MIVDEYIVGILLNSHLYSLTIVGWLVYTVCSYSSNVEPFHIVNIDVKSRFRAIRGGGTRLLTIRCPRHCTLTACGGCNSCIKNRHPYRNNASIPKQQYWMGDDISTLQAFLNHGTLCTNPSYRPVHGSHSLISHTIRCRM